MTTILERSQIIDVFRDSQDSLKNYTFGVNWGKIEVQRRNFFGFRTKKETTSVDLDFGCVMFDSEKKPIDLIFSPKYNSWLIQNHFPLGKSLSKDHAFIHQDTVNDNSQYKKVISIDPSKINENIETVFFYLNIDLRILKHTDFSLIESVKLNVEENAKANKTLLEFGIEPSSNKKNKGTLVLGKLFREDGEWKFKAIGRAIDENKFVKLTRGF